MTILLSTHPSYLDHDTGPHHPERPSRLGAVLDGARHAGVDDALVPIEPRPATKDELRVVHDGRLVDVLEQFCEEGGGQVDVDTRASRASFEAALLAAGSGLDAIERLDRGEGDAAFCVVRPPGHHATRSVAMGFCLLNNVAVAAGSLAARGERVLIVDYDAHHGNGTQAIFYGDPRVAYVSMHEYPQYPGTGRLDEIGDGDAAGTTINFPFPSGTTGDSYLAAVEEVVVPFAELWQPTWLLLSAGFDAHRADPLTNLGLAAGDYADLTARLVALVPAGRRVVFLEGGYDLAALEASAAACVAALAGEECRPEPATSGGPGHAIVAAALKVHPILGDG